MTEIDFDCANIPVAVAAKALKMDAQTVRLLLQSNAVPWGIAFKRPGSSQYCYIIYPKQFYEATGFNYRKDGGTKK